MQNRYTGDIGDFAKLGLLRVLQNTGLSIGVNWYLTPNETHNDDGRFVQYLNNESFRLCDEQLWKELKRIVSLEKREVAALQNANLLDALYYSELLFAGKGKAERNTIRENWHRQAVTALSGSDIVFVDPDNGILVPSAIGSNKENKYVKPSELADYYRDGASVIYYQHKARIPDSVYSNNHRKLLQSAYFDGASGIGLKFNKTSQRYFFFVVQPRHKVTISASINRMLNSSWNGFFSFL